MEWAYWCPISWSGDAGQSHIWLTKCTGDSYVLQHPFWRFQLYIYFPSPLLSPSTFFFFWSVRAVARCLLENLGPSKPPSTGFGSVLCLQLPDDTIWERGCHNTPIFCKRKQKFSVTNCSSYMLWQRLEAILFSHWTHLDSSHANAIIQKFLKRGLQYTAVASGSVSFVEFSADWWQRCRVSLEKQKTGSELSVQ